MTDLGNISANVRLFAPIDCGPKAVVSHLFFDGSNALWCNQGAFRVELGDRAPLILRQGEFLVTFPDRFLTLVGLEQANSLRGFTVGGPGNEAILLRLGFWDCFCCANVFPAENMEHLQELAVRQDCGDASDRINALNHATTMLGSVLAALNGGREALFYEAVRRINVNFLAGNVSLRSLYRELNCSPTSVVRIFRSHGQKSPSDYLHRLQIWRACQLLNHSRRTIDEIARVCGFSSNSAFTRFFRDWTNISPVEVREGASYRLPLADDEERESENTPLSRLRVDGSCRGESKTVSMDR